MKKLIYLSLIISFALLSQTGQATDIYKKCKSSYYPRLKISEEVFNQVCELESHGKINRQDYLDFQSNQLDENGLGGQYNHDVSIRYAKLLQQGKIDKTFIRHLFVSPKLGETPSGLLTVAVDGKSGKIDGDVYLLLNYEKFSKYAIKQDIPAWKLAKIISREVKKGTIDFSALKYSMLVNGNPLFLAWKFAKAVKLDLLKTKKYSSATVAKGLQNTYGLIAKREFPRKTTQIKNDQSFVPEAKEFIDAILDHRITAQCYSDHFSRNLKNFAINLRAHQESMLICRVQKMVRSDSMSTARTNIIISPYEGSNPYFANSGFSIRTTPAYMTRKEHPEEVAGIISRRRKLGVTYKELNRRLMLEIR